MRMKFKGIQHQTRIQEETFSHKNSTCSQSQQEPENEDLNVIRGQLNNPHQFSANANRLCITSEYNLRREREKSWEAAPQKQDERCKVIYCSIQKQQTSTYLLSERVVGNREMLISPNAQNCKATTGYLSVE
ncbi:hypothetical protein Peur_015414 [Populus x canadensis]